MEPFPLGSVQVDLARRWVERDGTREHLTTLETAVLRYLVESQRTVSREELLTNVWGYADTVISRACDTTVHRLRTKIEDDPSNPEVVLTVHGSGYRVVLHSQTSEATAEVEPPPQAPRPYVLGERVLDLHRMRIETPEGVLQITSKEAEVLSALIAAQGGALEREMLQRRIWGTAAGRPLANIVARLRRKLEPDPAQPRYLLTTAHGYRLDLPELEPPSPPLEEKPSTSPLPAEVDRHFGREGELDTLLEFLQGGERLVTLTGPGGVGKTRLALTVARQLEAHGHAAVWVDATQARSLDALYTTIALAAQVCVAGGDPTVELSRALGGRALLLVLDNLEQLPQAGVVVDGLLEGAPALRILATSRTLLRSKGERQVTLAPLEPEAAAALFLDRALPSLRGSHDEILALVHQLDGLPLAIELAAARTRVLSVGQIRERAQERLKLLAGGTVLASRHASMRASLDASWDLASPHARAALAQLTVFEGSFGVDAAVAVLDLSAWPEVWTVDVLQELVDSSLLRFDASEQRFSLLFVVHEYASERLLAPQRESAELRHGRAYANAIATGGELVQDALHGPRGNELRYRLQQDLPNVRKALAAAIDRADTTVATATLEAACEVWWSTGPYEVGLRETTRVLALPLSPRQSAQVLVMVAQFHTLLGNVQMAEEQLHTALALAKQEGDAETEVESELALCMLYNRAARFDEARQAAEKARARARQIESFSGEVRALLRRGNQERALYSHDQAMQTFAAARLLADAHGAMQLLSVAYRQTASLAVLADRLDEAAQMFERARTLGSDSSDPGEYAWLLMDIATLHRRMGRPELACANSLAAEVTLRRTGDKLGRGLALLGIGTDRMELDQPSLAEEAAREALETIRACGSPVHEYYALNTLAVIVVLRGDLESAERAFRDALSLARTLGNPRRESIVHANLGEVLCLRGAIEEGVRELEEALARYRAGKNVLEETRTLATLGQVLADVDRLDEAHEHAQTALLLALESKERKALEHARLTLARVAARRGETALAERLLEAVREVPPESASHKALLWMVTAELAYAKGDLHEVPLALASASRCVAPETLGIRYRTLLAAS